MVNDLDAYHAKRDFATTPEPSGVDGRRIKPSEHLRFVIHKHDATRLHYDLRLEFGGVFKSWAVPNGPSLDPGERRLAVEVEDHPVEYGDFEGTIPKAEYGGGTVMIWDRGFWAPESKAPPEQSLRQGELKLILAGTKLQGAWVLVRLKPKPAERGVNWLLIKHRDQWATPGIDTVLAQDRSVASGRAMAAIAVGTGKPPETFLTEEASAGPAAVWDDEATKRSRRRAAAEFAARPLSTTAVMPRLTHPDRVLWPQTMTSAETTEAVAETGLTKHQLAAYLLAVAPQMIAHLAGSPCSLVRAPDGITAATFFQRHAVPGLPGGVRGVYIDKEADPYLAIDDAQTLVEMARLSVIEFHPANGAAYLPDVPGRLIFDLDPAPDVAFDAVVAAANELHDRLTHLGLVPFCKTTGGKGLHVVVPLALDDTATWPQAKLFTQTIATQMASDSPSRYVTKMTKAVRAGRIYLDTLRNDTIATAVAPLSPRARPGATVSMPLTWAQVRKGLQPGRFTIETAPTLLAKSKAWGHYGDSGRSMKAAISALLGGTP